MENERTSTIKIGKKEYELVLTNKATKELNNKFGGLDKIGNIEGVTQDNLQLIMRIRALEKFLWEKGHNPEKIK